MAASATPRSGFQSAISGAIMPYEFLENITADVAFRAWGDSLESLLTAAADATLAVMLRNPGDLAAAESVEVELRSPDAEGLLRRLLQEMLFLRDTRGMFVRPVEIHVTESAEEVAAAVRFAGEPIDRGQHDLGAEVKAVTMHRFRVVRTAAGWEAEVLLDI